MGQPNNSLTTTKNFYSSRFRLLSSNDTALPVVFGSSLFTAYHFLYLSILNCFSIDSQRSVFISRILCFSFLCQLFFVVKV